MAKISTYPSPIPPDYNDWLIGTDLNDSYNTKNFKISDILSIMAKGAFYNTANQTAPVINTATPVVFDTTALLNAFTLVNPGSGASRITADRQSTYSLSFSPLIFKSTAGDVSVDFWIRINGTNVVGTNKTILVKGGGFYTTTNLEYFISLASSSYVEVCWSTPDLGAVLTTSAATGVKPSGYSASAFINQI